MFPSRPRPKGEIIFQQGTRQILLLEDGKIAKIGLSIDRQEAENLRFIHKHTTIPVPEVFDSYDTDDGGHCIVMARVPGITLQQAVPDLSDESKSRILTELIGYIRQLRRLQGASVSSASGSPTGMNIFGSHLKEVLTSPSQFHDFITSKVYPEIPKDYVSYLRSRLDDNSCLLFTHGDLVAQNIFIENGKISGIIGWGWAGYYPEHWEFVKFMTKVAWPLGFGTGMVAEFPEYNDAYLTYNVLETISRST